MQIQRFCGYHKELSIQKKKELVMTCKQLYKEGTKLSRGLPDTEPKTNDFFAILAVHLLMELHVETREGGRGEGEGGGRGRGGEGGGREEKERRRREEEGGG